MEHLRPHPVSALALSLGYTSESAFQQCLQANHRNGYEALPGRRMPMRVRLRTRSSMSLMRRSENVRSASTSIRRRMGPTLRLPSSTVDKLVEKPPQDRRVWLVAGLGMLGICTPLPDEEESTGGLLVSSRGGCLEENDRSIRKPKKTRTDKPVIDARRPTSRIWCQTCAGGAKISTEGTRSGQANRSRP
jgi:hypothetical protein